MIQKLSHDLSLMMSDIFLFQDPPTPEIYTLSLHDALPIYDRDGCRDLQGAETGAPRVPREEDERPGALQRCRAQDRKSTRLNSSHMSISYAVFCLKKKKL